MDHAMLHSVRPLISEHCPLLLFCGVTVVTIIWVNWGKKGEEQEQKQGEQEQEQEEDISGGIQEQKEVVGGVGAVVNNPEPASLETFKGNFQRISAEQLEEVLVALSVGFLLRKAASLSTLVMEIRQEEGEQWVVALKSGEFRFLLGAQFESVTPDGREVSCLVTVVEGRITAVQVARDRGQPDTVHTWQMTSADSLVYTLTVSGGSLTQPLVSTQTFRRVDSP